jgi:hypothetical protein
VVAGTSTLRNSIHHQFGKPDGAVVGRDKYRMLVESASVATVQVTATLPGGTIRCEGKIDLSRSRTVIQVIAGTGDFKGATGVCETRERDGRTSNVYRLELPTFL